MSNEMTRIGVVGAGYVGLTSAACLASLGHRVVCADIDRRKVEILNSGGLPIFEDGLQELVTEGMASGRLEFVLGADRAAENAEVVFLCVATPQGEDGSADLSHLKRAATEIASVLEPGAIVVNKSTVPVGSSREVARVLDRPDVAIVSNPEFLREGTAVRDFMSPDRIVIGSDDPSARSRVAALHDGIETEVILTDPASAETIKYAANGFLAMKLSFANEVAAMCEAVGADVEAVMDGIGSDDRIGRRFLNPGPGWGGSCFPKDSRALVKISEIHGYDFAMMRNTIVVNDAQRRRMVDKVARAVGRHPSDLSGVHVGALGLTFKAGTDDLRESPAMAIITELRRVGATVAAYDPTATHDLSPHQAEQLAGITLTADALSALQSADVVCIFTEWPEFADLDLAAVAQMVPTGTTVVDTRNLLDPVSVRAVGLGYDGVGRR